MTSEQLQAARAEKWRQSGNALLTLDEAKTWLEETGLALFLPRRAQFPIDAPSFVEAVAGKQDATPGRKTIEQATELLSRLAAEEAVVPLNLLGGLGEQPDYLVSASVLPYIYALRGDRDWKRGPQSEGVRSVSPLLAKIYEGLDEAGSATVADLRDQLSHEITESAVLRGLSELWSALRVIPVISGKGEPTVWQPLKLHHSKAMAQGSSTSQLTAISVLSSLYLQVSIAATPEEVEIFLSPLSSRSKIREVLRGLSATRQIGSLSMESSTYHFVAGTLPEFPEVETQPEEEAPAITPPAAERPLRRTRPMREAEERPIRRTAANSERRQPSDRPWQKKEGFERRSSGAEGTRPPRRQQGDDSPRPRRDRFEEGQQERPAARFRSERPERRSFDRPARSERTGPARPRSEYTRSEGRPEGRPERREFPKRGEGRGFGKGFERGGDRPQRREFSGASREEGTRERRPRFEDRGGERPSRPGFKRTGEDRERRSFSKPFSKPFGKDEGRPPRRESSRGPQGEGTRERRPRFEDRGGERPSRPGFKRTGTGEDRERRSFSRGEGRPPRRESTSRGPREEGTRERRPRFEDRGGERPARPGFKRTGEGREGRGFAKSEGRPARKEGEWKPRSSERPAKFGRTDRPASREGKRPSGFAPKSGRPKAGGSFGRKPAGGKFSKPGSRPAKKFGRKERPE